MVSSRLPPAERASARLLLTVPSVVEGDEGDEFAVALLRAEGDGDEASDWAEEWRDEYARPYHYSASLHRSRWSLPSVLLAAAPAADHRAQQPPPADEDQQAAAAT